MQPSFRLTIVNATMEMWQLTNEISKKVSTINGLSDFAIDLRKRFEPLFHNLLDEPTLNNLLLYAQEWQKASPEIQTRLTNVRIVN